MGFQIEMKSGVWAMILKRNSIPIIFRDRERGKSKIKWRKLFWEGVFGGVFGLLLKV